MAGKKKSDNATGSKLETALKVGGFIIALSGAVIGILQFTRRPKHDDLKEERINTYREASRIIGKLVNLEHPDSLKNNAQAFYNLYSGNLILVQDTVVESSMKRFKFELDDKLNGIENTGQPFKFKQTGMQAIKDCQESIQRLSNQ